jgi:methionine-S-sulfoxide reductase
MCGASTTSIETDNDFFPTHWDYNIDDGSFPQKTGRECPMVRVDTFNKSPDDSQKQASATAVFAGGCFWCTEAAFEQLEGVKDVQSGYTGGAADTANYRRVCDGDTGHAEAIRVTYDPSRVTYDRLLEVFFDAHDPTQLNGQGADQGTQYRSAIFYANEIEKNAATARINQLTADKAF